MRAEREATRTRAWIPTILRPRNVIARSTLFCRTASASRSSKSTMRSSAWTRVVRRLRSVWTRDGGGAARAMPFTRLCRDCQQDQEREAEIAAWIRQRAQHLSEGRVDRRGRRRCLDYACAPLPLLFTALRKTVILDRISCARFEVLGGCQDRCAAISQPANENILRYRQRRGRRARSHSHKSRRCRYDDCLCECSRRRRQERACGECRGRACDEGAQGRNRRCGPEFAQRLCDARDEAATAPADDRGYRTCRGTARLAHRFERSASRRRAAADEFRAGVRSNRRQQRWRAHRACAGASR